MLITNRDGQSAYDFADEARRQIEINLINNKTKKNDTNMANISQTLENLDSIKRILAKSQE
jgi:hypothetical protein